MKVYIVNRTDCPQIMLGVYTTKAGAEDAATAAPFLQVIESELEGDHEYPTVYVTFDGDEVEGVDLFQSEGSYVAWASPTRRKPENLILDRGWISYFKRGKEDRTVVYDTVNKLRRVCPGEENILYPTGTHRYANTHLPHRIEFITTSADDLNSLLEYFGDYTDMELNKIFTVNETVFLTKDSSGDWSTK